ncbi:MAG: hypothetical protein QF898_00495 [SAR202 cluster bacterium]|nr:hypothetical protein [SAR202 cluster bacterium]MDP6514418.1 hypothetical protein [SAR202 cluster bacterium]MDP6716324.1 hypothetical protein [SAR202 cluster bacterium]
MNDLSKLGTILTVMAVILAALAISGNASVISDNGIGGVYASGVADPGVRSSTPVANLGYLDETFDGAQSGYCNPAAPFTRKEDFQIAFLNHAPGEQRAFFNCDGARLYLPAPERPEIRSQGFTLLSVESIDSAWSSLEENGLDVVSQPRVVRQDGNRELWMAFFNDRDGNPAAIMSEVQSPA